MKNYCTIRHNIKGRLRVCIKKARYNEAWLLHVMACVQNLPHILYCRINAKCNSLVINYHTKHLDLQTIIQQINLAMDFLLNKEALTKKRFVANVCDAKCACRITEPKKDLVRPAAIRFAGLTAVMAGVFIRTKIFKLTINQSLLSPLGAITILACLPLFKESYKQLQKKKISLEGFLGTGCVAAVFSSQTLSGLEILWINQGAELLNAWVTERSRKSISDILQETSHHTFRLVNGVEVETKVSDLVEGDIVVLHTGEKVCIDGEIIDGHALIDESPITGRADFISRSTGDSVLAGTFVRQGLIYVCAQKVGDQTYLSRILCLVEDSVANKAPIEGVGDKLAKNMIRLGLLATVGTYFFTGDLWRAFTVSLVMACPCATSLAAGTAISAAMSAASKRNILIKGGRYLEEVGKTDCICFDKTGTLTTSEPTFTDSLLIKSPEFYLNLLENTKDSVSQDSSLKNNTEQAAKRALLQLVLSTEMHNHHPLAQAIKQEAIRKHIEPIDHTCCEYFLGMGMTATINGHHIVVGNRKLMDYHQVEMTIENDSLRQEIAELRQTGKTVLFVACETELMGFLAFENPIRSESKHVINILKENGIKSTFLITGDEKNTAQNLSKDLGITDFYASVMPEQKASIVKELQSKYQSVIMVGDGINDALALTEANIGIALGAGGSEVAVEAADITLVNDDLYGIVYVHSLSKQAIKIVNQNFWLAFISNIFGMTLGATGYLSPFMAGMFHIVHTLGVLGNSSRLLSYEVKEKSAYQKQKYIQKLSHRPFDENPVIDVTLQSKSQNNTPSDNDLLSDALESAIDINKKIL